MPTTIEIWRHAPESDLVIDRFDVNDPLDLAAETRAYAARKGLPIAEVIPVVCIRRGLLMIFHCGGEPWTSMARGLADESERYGGNFRRPTPAEFKALSRRTDLECYLDDLQLKPMEGT